MTGIDPLAATRAQLTAAWDVRGIDVATAASGTSVIHATHRAVAVAPSKTTTLPPLLTPRDHIPPSFELGRTLGQGGMGVVKAATQQALRREVAIKCLHEGAEPRAATQLLREARIVGALEHPNIIPVHALGADESGLPILVMKRVEGVGWDEALRESSPTDDIEGFLRTHLAILQQVAKAAHFAHQKGIVHRDIKPANVMLGTHDEVYLVDWGVAVSYREGPVGDVPRAREVNAIEGTPAYMAPEMAAASGDEIGPATDVYLLGATLYELLTGAPPHDGDTLIDVLTHAFGADQWNFDDWVPEQLREICRRSLSLSPDDRFQSAQDLAAAIDVVLAHRASVILTDEASMRLDELVAASNRHAETSDELHAIHTLFAECRFAFSHALATWSGNEAAREGLQRSVELMVEIELERGAPEAAALLLRDLPTPAPAIEEAVHRALKRRRQKGAYLERLVHDADAMVGARQRAWLALLLAAQWTIGFVTVGQLDRHTAFEAGHLHMLGVTALGLVVAAGAAFAMRSSLVSRLSRAQMVSIVGLQLGHLVAIATAWTIGLSLSATSMVMAIVGGVAFSTGATLIDRAYVPMVVTTGIGLALMIAWPSWHLELLGTGGGLGALLSARNLFRAANEDVARISRTPSALSR